MSEENKTNQEPVQDQVSESAEVDTNASVDFQELLKQKEQEIENLKKIQKGQDQKNSQLFDELNQLKKVISEKDQAKMSVEEQIQELTKQLQERDAREKQKEKEALVNRIIAENKLDPEYDFDFLHKFETEEMIKEKAAQRAEYYKKLKNDGFEERATGSVPKKGESLTTDSLDGLSEVELNNLVLKDPSKKEAVLNEIDRRFKQNG